MTHVRPGARAETLRPGQTLLLASLVFGLFFGAGNLIFPVELGREAGSAVTPATIGFLLTAVGLPVLGLVASALARSRSVFEMAGPVSRRWALFFACALYLTIGPLFATPRTATVSFEVGIRPLLSPGDNRWGLLAFTAVFFAVTAVFSLRPGRILDWVGRYLTPVFLVLLAIVIAAALVAPMSGAPLPPASGDYAERGPLATGLLGGYNTMDALASLAFAIVVVDALRGLGITQPRRVAVEIAKAGVLGGLGMAAIYAALAYVGVTTLGELSGAQTANGGTVLAAVSAHYFGAAGQYLIAAIVILACLKTAIGLTTACAEMFAGLFGDLLGYRGWAWVFLAVSFGVANIGLAAIIGLSVPVLMFLYPLAIVLIALGLAHPWLRGDHHVYLWVTVLTGLAAALDLVAALPEPLRSTSAVQAVVTTATRWLPGFALGFGWVLPALLGAVIGLAARRRARTRAAVRTAGSIGQ